MTDRNPDYHCAVCRKYLFSTRAGEPMAKGPHYCDKHKPGAALPPAPDAVDKPIPRDNSAEVTERPMACLHENFSASVGVGRLSQTEGGPITGYMAEIRIHCAQCGIPFQFLGLPPGYDNQGATVSLDGLEANIALTPQGMQPNPFQRMAYNIKAHN